MDALLLDTDVFSFLIKKDDTRAELYRPIVRDKTIALSFISVGELYVWTKRKNWGARRIADLEQRLKAVVIIPYDLELCKTYGRVNADLMAIGRRVPANDLWIAACAIRHSLPLVTHNKKDFEGIPNLKIISQDVPPPAETGGLFNP